MAGLEDFCFETVLSTDRNLKLLQKAKEKGYFVRCYYILTIDPMINVLRVKARVAAGGHDVPEEKIISRYGKTLALIKEVVKVCDICHIYDNSGDKPIRIFKKRKTELFYEECPDWHFEDIAALTGVREMKEKKSELEDLNEGCCEAGGTRPFRGIFCQKLRNGEKEDG